MAYTPQQSAAIAELNRRRASMKPAQVAAIDELMRRMEAPAAAPAQSEAEAFQANQRRIHEEKIAGGALPGDEAALDPTLYERAVTWPINAAGGIVENIAGLAAVAPRAAWDTVTGGPLDRIVNRAMAGDTNVMGYVTDLPVVNPVLRGAADVEPYVTKGIEAVEGAVGIRPNVNMEVERHVARTAGNFIDIPLFRWIKAMSGAAKGVEAGGDILEALAKKGVSLSEDQIKAVRAGQKLKLTAEQVKTATAQATPSVANITDEVAQVAPGQAAPPVIPAAATPPVPDPGVPVPPPLSPKAKALQSKVDAVAKKIETAEAGGATEKQLRGLAGWQKRLQRSLEAEIKASAKLAAKKAATPPKERPLPAVAGTADVDTSPEILFSEQSAKAPGLFRTEAQKIAIATGKAPVVDENDIARMVAQGHKPSGGVNKGREFLRRYEAPAPLAMGDTGPVGAHAENLLRDTNVVHEMRVQNVVDWTKRAFKGWTQDQMDIVIDALDGKITAEQMAKMTPEMRTRTEEVRRIFSGADREATQLKLRKQLKSGEVVDYYGRKNFFPHFDSIDIGEVEKIMKKAGVALRPDQRARLLKGVDVDDVLDQAQAGALRKSPLPPQRTKAGTTSGSITFERDFDGPFNRNLPEVIQRYVDRVYRQMEEVKHFGPDVQKGISELAEAAANHGENGEFIRNALHQSLGGGPQPDSALSEVATGLIEFESLSKLPFAFVGQINQIVNPMVKAGFGTMARNALRLADDLVHGNKSELITSARRGAVIFADVMQDLLGQKKGSWVGEFARTQMKWTGFKLEDEAFRYLSASIGVTHAEDLVKVARGAPPSWLSRATGDFRKGSTIREQALRELAEARVDVDTVLKTGKLTEMDKARYAKWFSDRVQFPMRKGASPLGFESSPGMKVLTLFKRWNINQMDLFRREVLKPLKFHDTRPLARWLVATPIVGEAANQVMDVALNRDRSESGIPKRVMDAYIAGSFGFLGQVINSVTSPTEWGDLFPTGRSITETGKLVGRTAKEVAGAGIEAVQEGSTQPLENMVEDWGDELAQFPEGEGRVWDYAAGVSRHAKAIRNYIRDDGEDHVIFKKFRDNKW